MVLGTTAAVLLATSIAGATAIGTSAIGKSQANKAEKRANAASDEAKREAEQKALMERGEEGKASSARKSLLAAPTSGFGPNTNLARSFLTTL